MKNKFLILVLLISASLAVLTSADAGNLEECGMYGMMSGNYGFSGMFLGWIVSILAIITLVLFIIWLIKQMQKK